VKTESFRPVSNTPPTTLSGKVKFFGRMFLDLQVWTVYRDLRRQLPNFRGEVLDVGCGQSPYRYLLDAQKTHYVGIDILDADRFDYVNTEIVPFDGENIPFPDETFDAVLCTEVLEHVPHFQGLVDEIRRVLKDGGTAVFTVPWSARYHYVPYDYFRYTPSSLRAMFAQFTDAAITPRGTDISAIASKLVVLWSRNLLPSERWRLVFVPLWLLASPILAFALITAYICTLASIGSTDDPLGYTIVTSK
jgi:ubiquinone/menaquinone biosynthesis C-methylase UbiE